MSKGLRAVTGGLVMLGVVACAASVPAPSPPASPVPMGSAADVQTLRERAAAFWAARVAGNYQAEWELLEPRGRGRITAQEYGLGHAGVRYLGSEVGEATVNGFFATVKVRVLFQPVLPAAGRVSVRANIVDDGWIRIGGAWYHRLEEGSTGGPSETRQP